MKLLQADYFNEFKCIGNKCINHCCKDWNITIDEETYRYYQSIETPFGTQLKQNIATNETSHFFKLNEHKVCPFFNENRLCDIYKNLGEENMCVTCKSYPRVMQVRADVMERTLSLSCPEVSRIIIETEDTLEFDFLDNITTTISEVPVDDALYNLLLNVRSCSIDIMQMRFFSLWERQLLLIILSTKVQDFLEKNDYSEIEQITNRFNDVHILTSYVIEFERLKIKDPTSLLFINNFVNDLVLPMNNLTTYMKEICKRQISENDPMGLYHFLMKYEQEFNQYMKDQSTMYENFYVHTLFRYYMNSLTDKNVMKQVILSNISYLLIYTYQMISWVDSDKQLTTTNNQMIFSSISILLEHNSSRYDQIFEILKKQNYTSLAFQALLLSLRF